MLFDSIRTQLLNGVDDRGRNLGFPLCVSLFDHLTNDRRADPWHLFNLLDLKLALKTLLGPLVSCPNRIDGTNFFQNMLCPLCIVSMIGKLHKVDIKQRDDVFILKGLLNHLLALLGGIRIFRRFRLFRTSNTDNHLFTNFRHPLNDKMMTDMVRLKTANKETGGFTHTIVWCHKNLIAPNTTNVYPEGSPMLGIFDSGFGGLTVLKPIHNRLSEYSTIYLGDNARAPYGTRSQEEIYQFTLEGVRFLFGQGCPLVVLACNTASSQALRRIQQEILPIEFPDRRVLGVVRPASEYLAKHGTRVGIIATQATVDSHAYVHELYKLNPAIKVSQKACPGLAGLIEEGKCHAPETELLIEECTKNLLATDEQIDEVLLACTHYPLVESVFRAYLPESIHLLSQGNIVAASLESYLAHHPEIDDRLEKTGERHYFTTNTQDISELASLFYGEKIQFEKAVIA